MSEHRPLLDPASLRYDDRGLLPVVAQDRASGAVLMVAWADRDAVERTLESGEAHFFSRSRQKPWRKGETSGNTLAVREVLVDCDGDTLLLRVDPAGPACHRDTRTCFEPNAAQLELGWLWQVVDERAAAGDAESSYSARLLAAGVERIARKVGEESAETIIAAVRHAARGDARQEVVAESSDLLYHLVVLLRALDLTPLEVAQELARRHEAPARRAAEHEGSAADGRGEGE